jgi:hypothetical protein
MQRELAFVEAVLAPALAGCYRLAIAEAQRVQLPEQLLPQQQKHQQGAIAEAQRVQQQQQQGSWMVQPGEMALLLPDVTLLDPGMCFALPWFTCRLQNCIHVVCYN